MIDAHYPLQALLYGVALHRFLRWRLPGYDPRAPPRRGPLPVPARHVRAGHARRRRRALRRVRLGAAARAHRRAVGPPARGARRDPGIPRRPRRSPARPHRHRAAGRVQRGRGARRGRRARREPGRSARRRARRTRCCSPRRSPCAAVRLGSVCVDLAAVEPHGARRGRRAPRRLGAAVAVAARSGSRRAGPGPLVADGAAARRAGDRCGSSTACSTWSASGARRSWSAGRWPSAPPFRRPSSTSTCCGRGSLRTSPNRRRPVSGSPRQWVCCGTSRCWRAVPARARPPPWRGCWRCSPSSPARCRGSRWPPPPARPPPGCRRRSRHSCPPVRGARVADAATLHRLLGWRRGGTFRYGRAERLPYDVVVVDETSMVSLPMMARLLDAVRPQARLVLVGDPDQLASVEAGAVLGDLARADGRPEPALDAAPRRRWACPPAWSTASSRSSTSGASTARSPRSRGPCRRATPTTRSRCCSGAPTTSRWTTPDALAGLRADVVAAGSALAEAAAAGRAEDALAALEQHRVLCAHRRGPFGVARWSAEVERWLAPTRGGATRGIRGGPCSSRPTTTTPASSTATPASSSPPRTGRGWRSPAAARPRSTRRPGWARSRACT